MEALYIYLLIAFAVVTVPRAEPSVEPERETKRGSSSILRFVKDELGFGLVHIGVLVAGWIAGVLPYLSCKRLRTTIYRCAGFQIGEKSLIYGRLTLTGGRKIYSNLIIGAGCRINTPCRIGLTAPVILEDRVVLGHGVTIITECHDMGHSSCRAGRLSGKPVRIRSGAWIGANSTLLPGVTIGAGAVVGAGSIVTRDVPENTLCAGNPARPIRALPTEDLVD